MVCTLQKRVLTVRELQAISRDQEWSSKVHRLHVAPLEVQELARPQCRVALGLFPRR
jgi:hypothetical protein